MLPVIHEIPIFVAGCVGTGAMISTCLLIGALGCQLGTSFVCIKECQVHPDFKKVYINDSSRDAVPTVQVSQNFTVIIPVRSLNNQAHRAFYEHQVKLVEAYKNGSLTIAQARSKIESFWAGALKKAVHNGNVDEESVMAATNCRNRSPRINS